MRYEEYKTLFELEDTYWWFVGRRTIIRTMLLPLLKPGGGHRILDVGCGTGRNMLLLSEFGEVIGADHSEDALSFCLGRGLANLVGADIERLPLKAESFDVVTAFEVLEHVEDDRAATTELARVLRPGGILILTAPAYQFLWSEHDEALDHRRRYIARQIGDMTASAGLRIERLCYCIAFLFLPILAFRLAQRLTRRKRRGNRPATAHIQMPRPISTFFVWLLRVEAWLLRWANLPLGVSIVCTARKPGAPTLRKVQPF